MLAVDERRLECGVNEDPIAALKDRDDRYRFLTENIPVQIWTALPDGRLDYVTDRTARHFGLTPERLLDEGWQNVVHPEDLPRAIERWMHSLSTGETYEVEFRLRLADGRYAFHLARAVAQRSESGQIVRWFGTNTDIDEQREEQRRVRALLEEVASQAKASEDAVIALRARLETAQQRIAQLEAEARARG